MILETKNFSLKIKKAMKKIHKGHTIYKNDGIYERS